MDPEDPDSDPDHSQNLIISSFYHFWTYPENFIKIHLSVFELFCSQTNKQRAKNDPRSGTLAVSG